MTRITKKDIEDCLDGSSIYVKTYSPGDGQTRYRFFRKDPNGKELSGYFGPENGVFTALGSSEAYSFARGCRILS